MLHWLYLKLYALLAHLLLLCFLPKALYDMILHGKYRNSFWQKFGRRFPHIKRTHVEQQIIWFHAVSIGETKAIAPLIKMWKQRSPDDLIVLSSITETGHAEAKRLLPEANYHVYLPLDFSYLVGPIVKSVQPNMVILPEGDLWPCFLHSAKHYGAKIVVVNGKISKLSYSRYHRMLWITKHLLQLIDIWCMQGEEYRLRVEQLGVPKEKIFVTGNLKIDLTEASLSAEQRLQQRTQWGITQQDLVLVLGSTHAKEEDILLHEIQKIWKDFPSLRVILVPRHPERFQIVTQMLRDRGFAFITFSELSIHTEKAQEQAPLILIDAIGVLKRCYQIADLAIVGGSYVSIGGHNILEPLEYGVPAIFGPHMHKQLDFVQLVQEYDIKLQCPQLLLGATVRTLLQDPTERKRIGHKGQELIRAHRGAVVRTWNEIQNLKNKAS